MIKKSNQGDWAENAPHWFSMIMYCWKRTWKKDIFFINVTLPIFLILISHLKNLVIREQKFNIFLTVKFNFHLCWWIPTVRTMMAINGRSCVVCFQPKKPWSSSKSSSASLPLTFTISVLSVSLHLRPPVSVNRTGFWQQTCSWNRAVSDRRFWFLFQFRQI